MWCNQHNFCFPPQPPRPPSAPLPHPPSALLPTPPVSKLRAQRAACSPGYGRSVPRQADFLQASSFGPFRFLFDWFWFCFVPPRMLGSGLSSTQPPLLRGKHRLSKLGTLCYLIMNYPTPATRQRSPNVCPWRRVSAAVLWDASLETPLTRFPAGVYLQLLDLHLVLVLCDDNWSSWWLVN